MSTAKELAASIQAESKVLTTFLRTLSSEDWHRASALGQWQIRDIVVHLAERALGFYTETIARGLRGEVSEPPGFDFPEWTNLESGRRNIEERAIERRADDMSQWVNQLADLSLKAQRLLDGLGPEDLDKRCWVRTGTVSVRDAGLVLVQELAIHSLDIRSLFESTPRLASESLPPLTDRVLRVLANPTIQALPEEFAITSGEVDPVRYRLTLTDVPDLEHDLILHRRQLHLEESSDTDPDARLVCDQEAFNLVFYKRTTFDEASIAESVIFEGDERAVSDLKAWLADVVIAGLH